MTTTPSLDCDAMTEMASSTILNLTLLVCNMCCIIAAPMLGYWLVRLWKMKLMHHNSRILVCFHIASLLVYTLGRTMLHTADLILYRMPSANGCEIMRTKTQCFLLRLPYNVSTNLLNCSAIFIATERLIATFNFRNYEGAYCKVGFCLLALQLLLSALINGIMYSQTRFDSTLVYYCQGTSVSNYMWTVYPFSFLLILQFISVIIFETASRRNKKLSRSSSTNNLTKRYQVEENLWTIATLKIFVYTNTTFMTTYLIGFCTVVFANASLSKPIYYSLIEITSTSYLYALALPVVLWCKRKDVSNQIRSAVHRNRATSVNHVFNELRVQWNYDGG